MVMHPFQEMSYGLSRACFVGSRVIANCKPDITPIGMKAGSLKHVEHPYTQSMLIGGWPAGFMHVENPNFLIHQIFRAHRFELV